MAETTNRFWFFLVFLVLFPSFPRVKLTSYVRSQARVRCTAKKPLGKPFAHSTCVSRALVLSGPVNYSASLSARLDTELYGHGCWI